MSKLSLLRRLSYHPLVSQAARALRGQHFLRQLYWRLASPPEGILRSEVGGIPVQFHVRTSEDLREVELGIIIEQHVIEKILSTLRTGDNVYDIGANIGLYSVILGKAVGSTGWVVAFEPMRENYAYLQNNLRLNGLTNVQTFEKALADRAGDGRLCVANTVGISQAPRLIQNAREGVRFQRVEMVEGDQFRELQKLPLPQVVKIDVEGYEYNVLLGLRKTLAEPSCRFVCCEIHPQLLPAELTPDQVLGLLKSVGFDHIEIYRRGTAEYHALAYKL